MAELQAELNRLAGTSGLAAQGAANAWAGTTGLALQGALNVKAGTSGVGINKVMKSLSNSTLDANGAAALISNVAAPTALSATPVSDTAIDLSWTP